MSDISFYTSKKPRAQEVEQKFQLTLTTEEFIAAGAALELYKRKGTQSKVVEIATLLEKDMRKVKAESQEKLYEAKREMRLEAEKRRKRDEENKKELQKLTADLEGIHLSEAVRRLRLVNERQQETLRRERRVEEDRATF